MRSVLSTCLVAVLALGIGACGDEGSASRLPDLEPLRFPDPASSPYCLPYPIGETATVSQAWGDSGTHRGRFSIDFSMPFGSEITAARPGVVTEIRDQYRDDDRTGGFVSGRISRRENNRRCTDGVGIRRVFTSAVLRVAYPGKGIAKVGGRGDQVHESAVRALALLQHIRRAAQQGRCRVFNHHRG